MQNKIIGLIFIVFLTVAFSFFTKIQPDAFFMSTIFTISSIMFSIGLGLVVTINLNGIRNRDYIKKIRRNINEVRNSFILLFLFSASCYILSQYVAFNGVSIELIENFKIPFIFSIFVCLSIIYCICYFIVNFLALQKLTNDISDEINEEYLNRKHNEIY